LVQGLAQEVALLRAMIQTKYLKEPLLGALLAL
jgi:hypothetical protein